jgi:hypothetical protein
MLFFLLVVLRILLRRFAADGDSEYVAEIFLRQIIELKRKSKEKLEHFTKRGS